ncbi:hypothetical protein [Xanthomonas bromi]|uniref:hypothetical protein n=1 Tax=Xanthomonas bromi TaxID=56449 RepID=UPI001428ABE9|nr:hypothetical protein [Xanthomonas bromi]
MRSIQKASATIKRILELSTTTLTIREGFGVIADTDYVAAPTLADIGCSERRFIKIISKNIIMLPEIFYALSL